MSALRKKAFPMLNISNYQLHLNNIIAAYFLKKHFSLTKFNSRMHMSKTYFALISH